MKSLSGEPASTKLSKLIIKNFRSIGPTPVEIDLDEIVILVGPNNSGKSSILRAYELAMSEGSGASKIHISDFPNEVIDPTNLPEIELHTVITENLPGAEWCQPLGNGSVLVKEKWVWDKAGEPVRRGYNVAKGEWAEEKDPKKVPWGAPNVAKSRRPIPHRVDAFDPPHVQAAAIVELLDSVIEQCLDEYKNEAVNDKGQSVYHQLLESVSKLQKEVVHTANSALTSFQNEFGQLIEKVFPGYEVEFDPKSEEEIEKSLALFSASSQLKIGPAQGYKGTIEKQGSGARRTVLWTALKLLAEKGKVANRSERSKNKIKEIKGKARPHLLLIDEPEICLHPNAVREARDLLYSLPDNGKWQVMATTHSPRFIDFSKDNTTIVRVENNRHGVVTGTTIFRPDNVQLDTDDKKRLKLLNLCDPHVAEFFFGGNTILVEGDTEYTAFNYIIHEKPEEFRDIHIVRARGKATIVSLAKILNHFSAPYSVLHDSDYQYYQKRGQIKKHPSWSLNEKIQTEVAKAPSGFDIRLVASLPNFESAYLGSEVTGGDKPYQALANLMTDEQFFAKIYQLLKYLTYSSDKLPEGAIRWEKTEDILNKNPKVKGKDLEFSA